MGKKKGKKSKKGAKAGPDDAAKNAVLKAQLTEQRLTAHVTALRKRAWDANSTAHNKIQQCKDETDEHSEKIDAITSELEYTNLENGKKCEKIDRARKEALAEAEELRMHVEKLQKALESQEAQSDRKLSDLKKLVTQREMEISEVTSANSGTDKNTKIRFLEQQLRAIEQDRHYERERLEKTTYTNKAQLRSEMRELVSKVGEAYKQQSSEQLGSRTRQALRENKDMGGEMMMANDDSDHLVRHCTSLTNKIEDLKHKLSVEKGLTTTMTQNKNRNEQIIQRLREMILTTQQECTELRAQLNESTSSQTHEIDGLRAIHAEELARAREETIAASSTNYRQLKTTLKMHDEGNKAIQKVGLIGMAIDSAVDELRQQHAVRIRLATADYGPEFADSPACMLLNEEHKEMCDAFSVIQSSFRDGGDQPPDMILQENAQKLRNASRSHGIKNVRSVGIQTNRPLKMNARVAQLTRTSTRSNRPASAPTYVGGTRGGAGFSSKARPSTANPKSSQFSTVRRLSTGKSSYRVEEMRRYL